MVFCPVLRIFKLQIVFNRTAWVAGFLILARRDRGGHIPKGDDNWDACKQGQKCPGEEAAGYFPSKIAWNEDEEGEEEDIGKTVVAGGVSW